MLIGLEIERSEISQPREGEVQRENLSDDE